MIYSPPESTLFGLNILQNGILSLEKLLNSPDHSHKPFVSTLLYLLAFRFCSKKKKIFHKPLI